MILLHASQNAKIYLDGICSMYYTYKNKFRWW